jgi:hypothetical protein
MEELAEKYRVEMNDNMRKGIVEFKDAKTQEVVDSVVICTLSKVRAVLDMHMTNNAEYRSLNNARIDNLVGMLETLNDKLNAVIEVQKNGLN